jgi:hypothetical protein
MIAALAISFSCTACDSDSSVLMMGPRDSFRAYFESPLSDTERLEGSIDTFQELSGEITVSTRSDIKLRLRDQQKYRLVEHATVTKNFEIPGITGTVVNTGEKLVGKNADNPFGPSETSNPVVNEYMRKFPGEIGAQRELDELQIYEMVEKTGSDRVVCVMSKNYSHAFLKVF